MNTEHCDYCNVCVEELDHHCPWSSKCIGRGNICAFNIFIQFLLAQIVFLIVGTCMIFAGQETTGRHNRHSKHKTL